MPDVLTTDVLVVGEGCAGQTAALAASEEGCEVVLLGDGRAPSTAISTGFLTFAAHDGFGRDTVFQAMSEVTGKHLCDVSLLRRPVDEAPREMAQAIEAYRIPVDPVERGLRARRALGRSGKDLLDGFEADADRLDTANDMTGLMMEFSSTHGTALYAQLRKAVLAAPKIRRLRGSAVTLDPATTRVGALVHGQATTIVARAVILATGGLQGLYEFTDTPATLTGDGHGMALDAGAVFVDMEFIQFYPLAVKAEGVPPIFLYPDFPKRATLVNGRGENVLRKHLGEASQFLADLHNWDELSALIQSEIVAGEDVFVDFRQTEETDWAPDSPTGTFLSKFLPDFRRTPVPIAPSSHYTIGGLQVDRDGRTSLPHVYAAGEVAGGVHGANRHGGTALVEAITFGRIAGRHAASHLGPRSERNDAALLPSDRRDGPGLDVAATMTALRRLNQFALGPLRNADSLEAAGSGLAALRDDVQRCGWSGFDEMQDVLRLRRGIDLSDAMRRAMLRRTETRGTHVRSDFLASDARWLRKQAVQYADGAFRIDDVPLN